MSSRRVEMSSFELLLCRRVLCGSFRCGNELIPKKSLRHSAALAAVPIPSGSPAPHSSPLNTQDFCLGTRNVDSFRNESLVSLKKVVSRCQLGSGREPVLEPVKTSLTVDCRVTGIFSRLQGG